MTPYCIQQWHSILVDIYSHLCLTDTAIKSLLIDTGPRPFTLKCLSPWGYVPTDPDNCPHTDLISDVLINVRVLAGGDRLSLCWWLEMPANLDQARGVCVAHWLRGSWLEVKMRCFQWERHFSLSVPLKLDLQDFPDFLSRCSS